MPRINGTLNLPENKVAGVAVKRTNCAISINIFTHNLLFTIGLKPAGAQQLRGSARRANLASS